MNPKFVAVAVSLLLIAVVTLMPQGIGSTTSMQPWCFPCGRLGVAEAVSNVVLFVPFGAAVHAVIRSTSRSFLIAIGVSLLIELLQLSGVVSGRSMSAMDVFANSLGGLSGSVLFRHHSRLIWPHRDAARRLVVAWLIFIAVIFWGGSWMLTRSEGDAVAKPAVSTLQFTPGFGWFEGSVTSASVDSISFQGQGTGALRLTAQRRARHHLRATIRGRDKRTTVIPVVFVHESADSAAHLMIAQRGGQLSLRAEHRGSQFGLHVPDIVLKDMEAIVAGVGENDRSTAVRTVDAFVEPGGMMLSLPAGGGQPRIARMELRASRTWLLLWPSETIDGWVVRLVTVVFLVCMITPLFHWTERAAWGYRWGVVAVVGGAMLIAPALFYNLSMPKVVELLAVVAAGAVTRLVARRADDARLLQARSSQTH